MSATFEKKLPWRVTWPGEKRDDFTADKVPEGGFCRIYLSVHNTGDGAWYWVANTSHRNIASGFARSAQEAAERAEAAWLKEMRMDGMSIFSTELAVKK